MLRLKHKIKNEADDPNKVIQDRSILKHPPSLEARDQETRLCCR